MNAEEFLNEERLKPTVMFEPCKNGPFVSIGNARKAIGIACRKYKDWSIEAHRQVCEYRCDDNCCNIMEEQNQCDSKCYYMRKFKERLNEPKIF